MNATTPEHTHVAETGECTEPPPREPALAQPHLDAAEEQADASSIAAPAKEPARPALSDASAELFPADRTPPHALVGEGAAAGGPAAEQARPPTVASVEALCEAPVHCANCGISFVGQYCSNCGQRHEPHIHSVGHFMHEVAESLTHADSRLWRTLWPLLAKPGFLTKEFFEGRRVSYLPPFRLYLVISAIFFVLWAALPGATKVVGLNFELDAETGTPTNINIVTPLDLAGDSKQRPDETPAQRAKRLCDGMTYHGPYEQFLQKRFAEGCVRVVQDHGSSFVHAFGANIPRSLFILLPGMAVLMKLLYWRPKRHYVEHLLFFVHNHAFVFLLLSLYFLVKPLLSLISPTWPLTMLVYGYIAVYSYKAMRRFYQQGKWLTRTKFVVLSSAYFFGATALLALTALFSFLAV